MKFLFLYTELAGYTIECFKKHLEKHPTHEIHVVHYPINLEAPFEFHEVNRLYRYERQTIDHIALFELIRMLNPTMVFSSGWIDKGYLKVLRTYKNSFPTVLCFDNHWTGNIKQRLLLWPARLYLKRIFHFVWVPGESQARYAKKLGFDKNRIFKGFYATDTSKFQNLFSKFRDSKSKHFPKRFICVARYVPQKGLDALWKAFHNIPSEERKGWELWCAGTGELWSQRLEVEGIKHLGFVQPHEMDRIIEQTGVFILPSIIEPWGVAVHEFAAAGFPLILSKNVGSASAFLVPGKNGFFVQAGNIFSIERALKMIINSPINQLREMGELSAQKAATISVDGWSEKLMKMVKNA